MIAVTKAKLEPVLCGWVCRATSLLCDGSCRTNGLSEFVYKEKREGAVRGS